MLENLTGTVVDGIIKLDKPLDLPNGTVVRITIQLIKPSTEALAAWESTQQR